MILFEGDDYIGGPVNLAARLCDIAAPREVLACAELAASVPADAVAAAMGVACDRRVRASRRHRADPGGPGRGQPVARYVARWTRRPIRDDRSKRSGSSDDGHVGRLVLNRPDKLNSMTLDMWREMRQLGASLLADPGDVRALVVTGEGRAFSSGLDTSVFAGGGRAGVAQLAADEPVARIPTPTVAGILVAQEAFTWLEEAPFATIAAIRGFALGGGLQLALACDVRIVARGARLGLLEFRYGIIPDLGGTQRLPRLVGAGKAKEMIFTAAQIDADEAYRIGLPSVSSTTTSSTTPPARSRPRSPRSPARRARCEAGGHRGRHRHHGPRGSRARGAAPDRLPELRRHRRGVRGVRREAAARTTRAGSTRRPRRGMPGNGVVGPGRYPRRGWTAFEVRAGGPLDRAPSASRG